MHDIFHAPSHDLSTELVALTGECFLLASQYTASAMQDVRQGFLERGEADKSMRWGDML